MSKIKLSDGYYLKVTTKDTGSNYNKFVALFKEGDKQPLMGTSFKGTASNTELIYWGTKTILNIESFNKHYDNQLLKSFTK